MWGGGQVSGTFSTAQALKQNSQQYVRELSFLKAVIGESEGKYDWVLIDCPPNLYLMTQNALHASDYYVVTAIPDHLSTIGLNILTDKVVRMGEKISAAYTFAGKDEESAIAELGAIVFVKVRIGGDMITTTHETTMNSIASRPYARDKVVNTYTNELIGYSEAAQNLVPVWEHNSTNARLAAQKNQYPEIAYSLMNMLS